jgi:hypothetical protein
VLIPFLFLLVAGPKLVRVVPVFAAACTDDGWCGEFPAPLDVASADGDGEKIVAISHGGVAGFYQNGRWDDFFDTGVGVATFVDLLDDGSVRACSDRSCVSFRKAGDKFEPVEGSERTLPGRIARRAAQALAGEFGDRGVWRRSGEEEVEAFIDNERLLARRGRTVLSARGSPLWISFASHVVRYEWTGGSKQPQRTRFPIHCSLWCEGDDGVLMGSAFAPTLQLHHLGGEGLYQLDGEHFVAIVEPGYAAFKENEAAIVGTGCEPCVVTASRIAIRRADPDRWEMITYPDIDAPLSNRARAVAIGSDGWPIIRFALDDTLPPRRHATYAFDGRSWSRANKIDAKLIEVPWDEQLRGQRGPAWPALDEHSLEAPFGERWTLGESALLRSAFGGSHSERWPTIGTRLVSAEFGVFAIGWGRIVMKRWERFVFGRTWPVTQYHVTGMKSDDVLYVRAGPDPAARTIATLAPGALVRGAGRHVEGRSGRWVSVETGTAPGWANAHFLREER